MCVKIPGYHLRHPLLNTVKFKTHHPEKAEHGIRRCRQPPRGAERSEQVEQLCHDKRQRHCYKQIRHTAVRHGYEQIHSVHIRPIGKVETEQQSKRRQRPQSAALPHSVILTQPTVQHTDQKDGYTVCKAVHIPPEPVAQDHRHEQPYHEHRQGKDRLILCARKYRPVERENEIQRQYRGNEPHKGIDALKIEIVSRNIRQKLSCTPAVAHSDNYRDREVRKEDPLYPPEIKATDTALFNSIGQSHARQQQEYINAAEADVLKEYLPLPKALAVRDKQPPLVHCKYPQSRKAHYRLAVLGYHRDHTLLFHFCLRKFVRINVCGLRNAAANIGR